MFPPQNSRDCALEGRQKFENVLSVEAIWMRQGRRAQDRSQWWAVVSTAIPSGFINPGKFFTSYAAFRFPRTLLRRIRHLFIS